MDQIQEAETADVSCVDKGLVAMFLEMSPEDRWLSNDKAVRAILVLRNALAADVSCSISLIHVMEKIYK
jgi:hypothetical protein